VFLLDFVVGFLSSDEVFWWGFMSVLLTWCPVI
jgi:hypothetical protein